MLQDGIVVNEMFHFLHACGPYGVSSAVVRDFLRDERWTFPLASRSKSSNLHRVFDDYRSSLSEEQEKLKCNASEALGLYGLLRHFVSQHVPEHADLAAKRASYEKLCELHGLDSDDEARACIDGRGC